MAELQTILSGYLQTLLNVIDFVAAMTAFVYLVLR
jgi:hypothetical protein